MWVKLTTDLCKYLIEKRAKINDKIKKYQQTPLHEAAWKGHLHVFELLVEKGAEIGVKDYEGNTALNLACR